MYMCAAPMHICIRDDSYSPLRSIHTLLYHTQAWCILGNVYVDGKKLDTLRWDQEIERRMALVQQAPDGQHAYREIKKMISNLGDPYTRISPPTVYSNQRIDFDGALQGVGVVLSSSPRNQDSLVIVDVIEEGPAFSAGIRPGDLLLAIDDAPTGSMSPDQAGQLLRVSALVCVFVTFQPALTLKR